MGKNPFEYIKEKDDLSNYSLLYQSKYLCEEVWKSLTKQKTSKKIKTTKKSEAINFLY